MTNRMSRIAGIACVVFAALAAVQPTGLAQRSAEGGYQRRAGGNFQAARLLKQADDLLKAGEEEQGVKMLETVIEQYPDSLEKYKAHLELAKHFQETRKYDAALTHLAHLKELKTAEEDLTGDPLELYLEGLYLTGITYYRTKQYSAAFPVLRKITRNYPNSIWANQSYYYIGMCHFEQENWNKAIEALELVGTFVDAASDNVQYMEAGHRLYLKIEDTDIPVLLRLGENVNVELSTDAGDREVVTCIPLSREGEVVIGSIPTDIGKPGPEQTGDGILQIRGGDRITARYVDNNTYEGQHNVARLSETRVVSTADVSFTLGTFDGQAVAAFLGQELYFTVRDADLDVSPAADPAEVKVFSRYRVEEEEASDSLSGIDVEKLLAADTDEVKYEIRDEATLKLAELGDSEPVHTGRFGGKVALVRYMGGEEPDQTDEFLACEIGDEVLVQYTDELHIGGETPETRMASIEVVGEIDSSPKPTQNIVSDAVIKARKNLVEGQAFLELARIFQAMGLMDGAAEKGNEGIERLNEVIALSDSIPESLIEKAYQRKWETQMAVGNYGGALNTCGTFNQLFPNSPLVDQALKEVARIHMENQNYEQAIKIFQRIMSLQNSLAKPEALFSIAECKEKIAAANAREERDPLAAAIPTYKEVSNRFPDSEYAGPALAKQVDYFFNTGDHVAADNLLQQIFMDYPDGEFLDSMLIKWVLVAFRMGDYEKSLEKAKQLVFEYPDSVYAEKAKEFIPRLEQKVQSMRTAGG